MPKKEWLLDRTCCLLTEPTVEAKVLGLSAEHIEGYSPITFYYYFIPTTMYKLTTLPSCFCLCNFPKLYCTGYAL